MQSHQQRLPHGHRGARGGGRNPESPHQFLDEAIALPTEDSARIARNTQLILQKEAGTTRWASTGR